MTTLSMFSDHHPLIIAALHLPPFPPSGHPDAQPLHSVIDYAVRNTAYAVEAGVPALYIQDLGDHPWGRVVQPYTIAMMSAVGAEIRRSFPDLILGVCLMSHGAREPIAVAQAIGAEFVRIKVYVGAMAKAEGILQGCAHEAVTYRAQCGTEHIAILADVYDRTGSPVAELPLVDAARMAATFGRADGLILTGGSFDESLQMLEGVRDANLGVPLLLGGGTNPENIQQAMQFADGAIVSSTFKPISGWVRESLDADWDPQRIARFMRAIE
ncbi:MAG: BtpA/SgcQ family protein [Chloroflexota bacterium]|nr:BtpA/SgcQ family protein [Chloroflexota bacterium]